MSIVQGTIEEGIYSIAQEKLKLEQDVTGEEKEASLRKCFGDFGGTLSVLLQYFDGLVNSTLGQTDNIRL